MIVRDWSCFWRQYKTFINPTRAIRLADYPLRFREPYLQSRASSNIWKNCRLPKYKAHSFSKSGRPNYPSLERSALLLHKMWVPRFSCYGINRLSRLTQQCQHSFRVANNDNSWRTNRYHEIFLINSPSRYSAALCRPYLPFACRPWDQLRNHFLQHSEHWKSFVTPFVWNKIVFKVIEEP